MVLKNDDHSGDSDDYPSKKNGVGFQNVDCQDSGMLQKSAAPVRSVEEGVCSERGNDANNGSCGLDSTNDLGQAKEAADCPSISGSQGMDCDNGGEIKKQSKLLEASTQKSSSCSSEEDGKVNKSNKRAESEESSLPPVATVPELSTDDSEVEEDVKVCDICGDTGREDLLAVCSRCSDGAEHTYCMREKLDKVPEGEWLCEECKFNDDLEARKLDQSKKLVSNNERNKSLAWTSSLRLDPPSNLDNKDPISERNKPRSVCLNKQASLKRSGDRFESGTTAKKQALESSVGSPTSSSPGRATVMSKDIPVKNLDKTKNKPSNHIPSGNESTGDSPTRNAHHVMKGNFLKSNSFSSSNSKQNLKASEDLQNQKQGVDAKDGPGKLVGKSMSFKGLGRSSAIEPKVKMLSPNCAPTHDQKGLKHNRDRNSLEKKNTMRLDHSFPGLVLPNTSKRTSRGADGLPNTSGSANRDYKNVQTDGRLANVSKQAGHMGTRSSESAGLGSTSFNGTSNSSDAKSNHSYADDGPTFSHSRTADRSRCADGQESQTEIAPEKSTVHSRQGLNGGVVGSKRRGPLSDASAPRSKEGLREENRLKAAIEAAMLKKQDIFKKNKIPEKPVDFSLLNEQGNHIGDVGAEQSRDSISEEATHDGDTGFHNPNFSKQMTLSSVKQFNTYPGNFPKSPVGKTPLTVSAIPEQESVWQGGFEIHRTGKVPDMCGGFQAHMSSSASGKVLETVKMFPQQIVLNEVPRPCAWPVHFKESGAREDHIALYFFPKDFESYIRNYKILVEFMMKHDLAFKGNINGVELLVFPSNHLPHKSQCWNTLYFMWGVCGRRMQFSEERLGSLGTPELSSSNTVVLGKDIASSENPCLPRELSVSRSGPSVMPTCEVPVICGSSIQHCPSLSNGDCPKKEVSVGRTCLSSPIESVNSENMPKNHETGLREAWPETGNAASKNHWQNNSTKSLEHQKSNEVDVANNVLSNRYKQEGDAVLRSEDVAGNVLSNQYKQEGDGVLRSEDVASNVLSNRYKLEGDAVLRSEDVTSNVLSNQCKKEVDAVLRSEDVANSVLSSRCKQEVDVLRSEDPQKLDFGSSKIDEVKNESSLKQENPRFGDTLNGVLVKLESDIKQIGDMDHQVRSDEAKLKSEGSLKQEGYMDMNVSADCDAEDLQSVLHASRTHSREDSLDSISPAASTITYLKSKRSWLDRNDITEDRDEVHINKKIKESESFHESNLYRDPSSGDKFKAQTCGVNTSSGREDASSEVGFQNSSSMNPGSAEGCFFLVNSHPVRSIHSRDSLPVRVGLSESEDRLPDGSPNLELALGLKRKQIREGGLPFFTGLVDRKDPDGPPEISSAREEEEDANASLSLSLGFPFLSKESTERAEGPSRTAEHPLPRQQGVNTSLLLFRGSLDK